MVDNLLINEYSVGYAFINFVDPLDIIDVSYLYVLCYLEF